jgi:hypothetical protein
MKRIKLAVLSIMATLSFAAPLLVPATTYGLFESAKEQACAGANLNDSTNCNEAQNNTKVSNTLASVINILSLVLGIIAVIMVIVGGIKFTTSQGDGNATASARNTIIYAVVGLVVAALAQVIVKFVLSRV